MLLEIGLVGLAFVFGWAVGLYSAYPRLIKKEPLKHLAVDLARTNNMVIK